MENPLSLIKNKWDKAKKEYLKSGKILRQKSINNERITDTEHQDILNLERNFADISFERMKIDKEYKANSEWIYKYKTKEGGYLNG